jgi:hypothetical protein
MRCECALNAVCAPTHTEGQGGGAGGTEAPQGGRGCTGSAQAHEVSTRRHRSAPPPPPPPHCGAVRYRPKTSPAFCSLVQSCAVRCGAVRCSSVQAVADRLCSVLCVAVQVGGERRAAGAGAAPQARPQAAPLTLSGGGAPPQLLVVRLLLHLLVVHLAVDRSPQTLAPPTVP